MPAKPSVTIVGAGNLGSAMALALHAAGYRIDEIVSRPASASRRRAQRLATQVGAVARVMNSAVFDASVVWLCVADDDIPGSVRQLARRGKWNGKIVLHSSGALSSDLLIPLHRRGAATASLHPMMTFVRGVAPDLRGVWFAAEGDSKAVCLVQQMVRDLSGKRAGNLLAIRKEDKGLYHSVGSFSSPMIVAILDLAERIARKAGVPARSVRAVMAPIVRSTIENYLKNGAAASLSGPLRRGDVTTIREHLKALRRVPGALDVYRALVRSAMTTLPIGKRAQIKKLIG